MEIEEEVNSAKQGNVSSLPHPNFLTTFETCVNVPMSFLSLVALAAFCRLVFRRVETKHPVYALLAQCLVVQAVLQFMFCGITLVRSFAIDKEWGKMAHLGSMFLIALLRQFYETSWACVSYLRYFFITKKDSIEQDVDFGQMRNRFLRLVWVYFAFHMVLAQVLGRAISSFQTESEDDSYLFAKSLWQRLVIFVPVHVVIAIPDLISVAIYLRLRQHVARLQAEQDSSQLSGSASKGPPYGGIYVGSLDNGEEVAAPPASSNATKMASSHDKEIACAMTALKTYSLTCLYEVFVLTHLVFAPELGFELHLQLWEVWIPLATIAINFGTLRSIAKECLQSMIPNCARCHNQVGPEG